MVEWRSIVLKTMSSGVKAKFCTGFLENIR